MPLYFINGVSGAGKSTILESLRSRGFEAYDVDVAEPVTAKWHNDATGFIHPKSSVKAADRTKTFLAEHSWKVPRQEVAELRNNASDKTVFFGGSVTNESEFIDLCDGTFSLMIDDKTMLQRLATRTTNDWGKSHQELELSLAANKELSAKYKTLSYTLIDASQSVEAITEEIMSACR